MDFPRLDGVLAASAAEQGVHPGRQLRRREGLGHIVVGAGHQARHLVHLLGPGGQHDDADLRIGGPNAAAHFKAVDARQHDIQQCHLGVGVLLQALQRLLAALGLDDIVAGAAQIDHDKAADTGLVLQNQYFFHGMRPFLHHTCSLS